MYRIKAISMDYSIINDIHTFSSLDTDNFKIEITTNYDGIIKFLINFSNKIKLNINNGFETKIIEFSSNIDIKIFGERKILIQSETTEINSNITIMNIEFVPNIKIISIENFDWKHYINNYDDLTTSQNTQLLAYSHLINHGINEGRYYRQNQSYYVNDDIQLAYYYSLNNLSKLNINPDIFLHHDHNIFIISNINNGGANKYMLDLLKIYSKYNLNIIFITCQNDIQKYINFFKNNDTLILQYILFSDLSFDIILNLVSKYNLKLIIPLHDNYYLIDDSEIDIKGDLTIHEHHNYIPNYKKNILREAHQIIFPSKYIFDVFNISDHDIKNKLFIKEHIDELFYDNISHIPIIEANIINIGIITEISKIKGYDLLKEIIHIDNIDNYKIIYHFFSPINFKRNNIIMHGRYNENEIYSLLIKNKIHGLLFFNSLPETYSFALTKGINSSLPIYYTPIGAIKERLEKLNNNRFISSSLNYSIFIKYIINNQLHGNMFKLNNNYLPINCLHKIYDDIFKPFDNNLLINKIHDKIKPFALYIPQITKNYNKLHPLFNLNIYQQILIAQSYGIYGWIIPFDLFIVNNFKDDFFINKKFKICFSLTDLNNMSELNIISLVEKIIHYCLSENYYKINNKIILFINNSDHDNNNLLIKIFLQYKLEIELILNSDLEKHIDYNNHSKIDKNIDLINDKNYLDYNKYINNYLLNTNDNTNIINTIFTNIHNNFIETINNDFNLFIKFLNIQLIKYHSRQNEFLKIFVINSWNDWNNSMCIEPSEEHGYIYLKIIYSKLVEFFV